MSMLFGSAQAGERRSLDSLPWDRGGSPSLATPEAALRLIPVYAAVSLIADSIATLPLQAFRRTPSGAKRIDPAPSIVSRPAPPGGRRIGWTTQAIASLLLKGNAYGVVVSRDAAGYAEQVYWMNPDHVTVDEKSWVPRYSYNGRPLDPMDVIHIPAFVMPGSLVGVSPITAFRLQFTKGLRAQEYATSYFDRGVAPPGVLKNTEQTLDPAETQIAKDRFKAAVSGRDIFVTGKDWDWTSLSVSAADQLFLVAIEASATEVAAIFRVAPEDIGGKTGYSRTYSTLTMELRKFATRTMQPWTARMEEAISSLMRPEEYAKYNLDASVRSELKERMEAHKIALETGLETQDEGRALEERPPLTPAEVEAWQNLYGRRSAPATQQTRSTENDPEETS